MPTAETDRTDDLSLSAERRIDEVCRRFEGEWKAGREPRPADYLGGWEGEELAQLRHELTLLDAEYRRRAGETPTLTNDPHQVTPTAGFEPPAEDPLPLPRPFGRYTLRRQLGRGGMGRVYLAHDPQLDRLVALKMPNPVEGVAAWRERFLTEARAAATLTHPNVCPVYDVGEADGQPYLTMAYIDGETLAAKLAREGPLAPEAAVELLATVARAMHEAHARGIVHRDLKPANLMLDRAGRPVIMDFGLAIRSTTTDDLRLTLTGVALGTPAYMPPEQAGGEHEVGPASDVYSLGVILFELVTGRVPFKAKSFGKLLAQIERDAPPAPSSLNPALDPALEAVILTALAKSPADRFASAAQFADALDQHLSGDRQGLISMFSRPFLIPDATGEYRPERSIVAPPKPPKRRRGWALAGAATAALLFALIGAAVLYVKTDYGHIVVKLSDPKAKVAVAVDGQVVTQTPDGGKPIRVRDGKDHKGIVSGDGFETSSESYEVKRGEVTETEITLVPVKEVVKVVPLVNPADPPKPPLAEVPKPEPPKPVPYPKEKTLVKEGDWELLPDATKGQMQERLDDRKEAKHSVTWLDAMSVDGKPLFCAVAALDDRAAKWKAFRDTRATDSGSGAMLERVNDPAHYPVAMSGYGDGGKPRSVSLWQEGGYPTSSIRTPVSRG